MTRNLLSQMDPNGALKPGEARCPGALTTQEIVHRDAVPVPKVLELESYKFLGDEDIPYIRYFSPEFFAREMDKMWTKVWQWACREEHIPNVGDYLVYDIGARSILVVRSADNEIEAFYNACLHPSFGHPAATVQRRTCAARITAGPGISMEP